MKKRGEYNDDDKSEIETEPVNPSGVFLCSSTISLVIRRAGQIDWLFGRTDRQTRSCPKEKSLKMEFKLALVS